MAPIVQRLNLSRRSVWFQAVVPGGSIVLCFVIAFIFWIQPDACAAILVLPRWLWIVPGLLFAVLGFVHQRKGIALIAVSLWLFYIVLFVQEWRSVLRFQTGAVDNNAKVVRVISLNCAAGDEKAAAEVAQYNPDIVLFEETPLRPIIQRIAPKILGPDAENLSGSDVSIVTRGKLTPVSMENSESAPFNHARIRLPSGLEVDVFAVRLKPYGIRADLWSPGCWREQCENRKHQREQFQWLAREVEKIPADVPIILGGDFNLPAGDKLFRILPARIRDTFRTAGHGWGDTLVNDFPFIRIDQIWCDEHFQPVSTIVHRTVNSDHRMVVADLIYTTKR
ncbi:MAG TPA: endonuclease/exonuclease/phosphatase family protein [Verrucomicrobiae bacterium]|nr:endonuclease/exonuclease/phosphatase family protein [Verrucomicrobiae bacterium]